MDGPECAALATISANSVFWHKNEVALSVVWNRATHAICQSEFEIFVAVCCETGLFRELCSLGVLSLHCLFHS